MNIYRLDKALSMCVAGRYEIHNLLPVTFLVLADGGTCCTIVNLLGADILE